MSKWKLSSRVWFLLTTLSYVAASASATEILSTGRWAARIADHAYICRDRSAAWIWTTPSEVPNGQPAKTVTKQPKTVISIIDSGGVVLRHWNVGIDVDSIAVTDNCRVAWLLDVDHQHLMSIDRDADLEPMSLAEGTNLQDGILSFSAAQDGVHAWLRFDSNRPAASVERSPAGIRVLSIAGIKPTADEQSIKVAFRGERIYIVPASAGLWIADIHQARPVQALSKISILDVYAGDQGRVAWVWPEKAGLFLVDDQGKLVSDAGAENLLPDEDVLSIRTGPNDNYSPLTFEYAWITTRSRHLYGFKIETDADGRRAIRRLNDGAPIRTGPGNDFIYSASVSWTGSGDVIWVLTTPSAGSPHWTATRRVSVRADLGVTSELLDPQLYESAVPRQFFVDYPRPDVLWVRTADYVLYEIDARDHKFIRDPFRALPVTNIETSNRPDRLWVVTAIGQYLVGPASDLTSTAKLDLGGNRITASGGTFKQQLIGGRAKVEMHLPLPQISERAHIFLSIAPTDAIKGAPAVADGEGELDMSGHADFPVFVRENLKPLSRYDVHLTYTDNKVFDASLTWVGLSVELPWYQWPYVMALGLLGLPVLLLTLSLSPSFAIRQWVPIAVPLVEAAIARIDAKLSLVSIQDIGIVAALSFAAVFLAAMLSPSVLRAIAPLHPYKALLPLVMQSSFIRRRFFTGYVRDLARAIDRIRASANGESYVSLPCALKGASPDLIDTDSLKFVESISGLTTPLDYSQRVNILIEAPGGRGKSALLNELVSRGIAAFIADPRAPLPILGDARLLSVEKIIGAGLGRHKISDDYIKSNLSRGDMVIYLDGLSESGIDGTMLEGLFATPDVGDRLRICATTRPVTAWTRAIQSSDRWIIIEPQRLTRASVGAFVTHYSTVDGRGEPMALDALEVAQAADNTYLPLLVRFAMLASSERVQSVADLYAAVLEQLLRRSTTSAERENLAFSAEELAVDAYWNGGERVFDFERSSFESNAKVQRLLDVGILIDADNDTSRLFSRPRRVRYVHDSMQSYLVARFLFRRNDWGALFRAAGDPRFAAGGADFLSGTSSELFALCLHVFAPQAALLNWLKKVLEQWAVDYGSAFSVDQLRAATPDYARPSIENKLPVDLSSHTYLVNVVDMLMRDPMIAMGGLARLFGALAPVVWALQHLKPADATEEVVISVPPVGDR